MSHTSTLGKNLEEAERDFEASNEPVRYEQTVDARRVWVPEHIRFMRRIHRMESHTVFQRFLLLTEDRKLEPWGLVKSKCSFLGSFAVIYLVVVLVGGSIGQGSQFGLFLLMVMGCLVVGAAIWTHHRYDDRPPIRLNVIEDDKKGTLVAVYVDYEKRREVRGENQELYYAAPYLVSGIGVNSKTFPQGAGKWEEYRWANVIGFDTEALSRGTVFVFDDVGKTAQPAGQPAQSQKSSTPLDEVINAKLDELYKKKAP